ncbi:MAG TPA: hypothetical protein EYQ08_02810 [Planctomycetes bacterium]|nr:hypothetical protein [Planctomycetota bacterium]HIK81367.1 hypothetical protein [Planctomycetota bacterium]
MNRSLMRLRSALLAVLFAAIGTHAFAQNSLTITDGQSAGLASETLSVLMDADASVEGFVLAITFDNGLLSVTNVVAGSATTAASAELVVPETLPGGFTLGVVVDASAPFDGQEIPAGLGQEIAAFTLTPQTIVTTDTQSALEFSDGVLNNPPLSNLLVQNGQSIGAANGLGLNNGTMTLLPPPPDSMRIESIEFDSDSSGAARVLLSNSSGAVQGYVLAVAHDSALVSLQGITLGAETLAAGAELVVPELYSNGGTLGVVLDFESPFEGQSIATGADNHIASFTYSSNQVIENPDQPITTAIELVNGQLGSPALDNVIVVAGLSISPALEDGTLTLLDIVIPVNDTAFYIGQRDFPETGTNGGLGFPGQEIEFCFFYSDPNDNIQGIQMAVCYDDLLLIDGTFTIEGSIADELGAEFVNYQIDNDDNDGDGRELVAGILMDALPPFENQQLPSTSEPLMIACVQAEVDAGAACGDSFTIDFCDGINGNGMVPINNLVVIEYQSIQSFERYGATYEIIPVPAFQRGDCNTDTKVDLADAATVIASQFQGYGVGCLDACDANDDSVINLADSVFLLNFLFKFGPPTPAPGAYTPGADPTEDDLDCALPASCN